MQLTQREEMVFAYLIEYFERNDQLPACHVTANYFGWASPNAALDYFNSLKRKGLIEKNDASKWRFSTGERKNLCSPFEMGCVPAKSYRHEPLVPQLINGAL